MNSAVLPKNSSAGPDLEPDLLPETPAGTPAGSTPAETLKLPLDAEIGSVDSAGSVGSPRSRADDLRPGVPRHVTKHLVTGTSALGAGILVERGFGFLANILAARLGGASTFGAYSLAITTANNISTYAAGGIGATAARFSGKYPRGGPGYGTLARVLLIVSTVSAAAAAAALWLGAGPIAHLLGKSSLTGLLRWAAFSAAGMILLECARGFFVGQRRLRALILLSVLVGAGMVVLLPSSAAHHSPVRMIMSQGAITTGAVLVCMLLARPLGLRDGSEDLREPLTTQADPYGARDIAIRGRLPIGPMLREVWTFGMVQLASLVGANLAGWWLASLVARSDTTLVQMGFFSIASQLRNMVGLVPGLLTESSYSVMAEREGAEAATPGHVMAMCTYIASFLSLLLAGAGILVVPWGLTLLYGRPYGGAAVTTAFALAIAVVHMGNSPTAARLTILSIRTTGLINTAWAISVALAATVFLLHGGSAAEGMAIYLAAHVLSASLVLLALSRGGHVPAGVTWTFLLTTGTAVLLSVLAAVRTRRPDLLLSVSALMLLIWTVALWALVTLGKRHGWLPDRGTLQRLSRAFQARISGIFGSHGRQTV